MKGFLINLTGSIAGILTTISFLPQVYKAWRSKRCDDLSYGMLLTFGMGVVMWLVYGLLVHAPPIVVANAVTLALILTLLSMKSRYRSG